MLPVKMQLVTTPAGSPHAPPPLWSRKESPLVRVAPFVSVKPDSTALVPTYAQRTAAGPQGPAPWMDVVPGPLTLRTVRGLSIATRLVMPLPIARPPVAYTPLLTATILPAGATSTAAWIVALAFAHVVPSAASFPFVATNHVVWKYSNAPMSTLAFMIRGFPSKSVAPATSALLPASMHGEFVSNR